MITRFGRGYELVRQQNNCLPRCLCGLLSSSTQAQRKGVCVPIRALMQSLHLLLFHASSNRKVIYSPVNSLIRQFSLTPAFQQTFLKRTSHIRHPSSRYRYDVLLPRILPHAFPLHFPSFWVRKSECLSLCLRFFLCFVCPVYSTYWLVACRSTVKVSTSDYNPY